MAAVDEGTAAARAWVSSRPSLDVAQFMRVGARAIHREAREPRQQPPRADRQHRAERAVLHAAPRSKGSRACATRSARRWSTCSRNSTGLRQCKDAYKPITTQAAARRITGAVAIAGRIGETGRDGHSRPDRPVDRAGGAGQAPSRWKRRIPAVVHNATTSIAHRPSRRSCSPNWPACRRGSAMRKARLAAAASIAATVSPSMPVAAQFAKCLPHSARQVQVRRGHRRIRGGAAGPGSEQLLLGPRAGFFTVAVHDPPKAAGSIAAAPLSSWRSRGQESSFPAGAFWSRWAWASAAQALPASTAR